jgi:hypothetical protein
MTATLYFKIVAGGNVASWIDLLNPLGPLTEKLDAD